MNLVVVRLLLTLAPAAPDLAATLVPEFSAPAGWVTAESTVATESTTLPPGATSGIHWHIDVDHTTGEIKYPVGWPRTAMVPKAGTWDWTDFDYLTFQVYADTSREALPNDALNVGIRPATGPAANFRIPAVKGRWVEMRIPIQDVPAADNIKSVQWNIAESNYKHLDKLDFVIADLKLLRYSRPAALEFGPTERVLPATAGYLVVGVHAVGIERGQTLPVKLVLRQGAHTVGEADATVCRGRQRLLVAWPQLPQGDLTLALLISGQEAASAPLTVIPGPFAKD